MALLCLIGSGAGAVTHQFGNRLCAARQGVLQVFDHQDAGAFAHDKPVTCLAMARSLLARGPKAVLVKHLSYPGKPAESFEMLLVTAEGSWHLRRPLLAFPRQPVGVGDLTDWLLLRLVTRTRVPKGS